MLGVVAERDAPLPAVDENADLPWRHGKLGFGQKPAGHQSVGERHRGGVGTGKPHPPETVGRRKIEAAVRFRRPDPRQAVAIKRRPKALGTISQVGQDARGRSCTQRVHPRTNNCRATTPRRITDVPPRSAFDGLRKWTSASTYKPHPATYL